MAVNFKCCRNKVQPNWICLRCGNVFHKKCRERIKDPVTVIRDNLIWCSRQCCEMSSETDPDMIDSLKQIIDDLKSELEQKTRYIERLKGEMSSFVEEATSSEEQLVNENEELKKAVARLGCKLREREAAKIQLELENQDHISVIRGQYEGEIRKQKSCILGHEKNVASLERGSLRLEADLSDCRLRMKDLVTELKKLKDLGDGMLVTVDALTKENICLSDELEALKHQLSSGFERQLFVTSELQRNTLQNVMGRDTNSLLEELSAAADGRSVQPIPIATRDDSSKCSQSGPSSVRYTDGSKNKIVICGDESARGISSRIRNYFDSSRTDTLGVVKPGCCMKRLSADVFELTRSLGRQDTAIICLNFDSLHSMDRYIVNRMCAVGRYCNVIFNISYSCLRYSNILFNRLTALVSLFLRTNSASIRVFSNDNKNRKFRLTRSALCRCLTHYISCNDVVKNSITLRSVIADDVTTNLAVDSPVEGFLSSSAIRSETFLV